MRKISVGRVLVAAGAAFSALCGLAEDLRLTGDHAGTQVNAGSGYDCLNVGGTDDTDAAKFKITDGDGTWSWNPVILTSGAETVSGITFSNGICVGAKDGVKAGALRIEGGVYTNGTVDGAYSIQVGETGAGYLELAYGTLICQRDARFSGAGGGTVVIGSNESNADRAVIDVDVARLTYISTKNGKKGNLTIRSSGVLRTCYICDEASPSILTPASVLTLDGGTICRSGTPAASYGDTFLSNTPLYLTSRGGVIDIPAVNQDNNPMQGIITKDIIDVDTSNVGVLTKRGGGSLVLQGAKSYAGKTVVEAGNLTIDYGVRLGKLKLGADAKLTIDLARGSRDSFRYPLLKEGATVELPDGAEPGDYIQFGNEGSFVNLTVSLTDGVLTVSGDYNGSDAVAEIAETGLKCKMVSTAMALATEGQTVRLLNNTSLSGRMEFKGSTLDLNGHTLTRNGTDSVIEFAGSAVVTNGTILADTAYQAGGSALLSLPGDKNAVLTVVDVNVGDEAGHNPFCVFNTRQNATVKIRNGVWHVATLLSSYYASGRLEISGGRFYLRGWHTANENYRKGTVVLSGGLYSLAPRASYAATDYVVQHRPGAALPYAVVSAATEGLVKPDGWSFAYADQATADAAVVVKLGEAQTPYTSLADAVRVAKEGDTVTLVGDTVSLPEQVTIDKNITIEGNGHLVKVPQPYVAESGFVAEEFTLEYAAVFFIAKGADAVIRNVHVMGGGIVNGATVNDGCYGVRNEGTVFLDNVTVTRSNGAVWNNEGAYLYADNCRFVRNCRYCAGALYNHGTAVLVRTSLSENRSLLVGGGASENSGTMYLNNCVICNNSAAEIGGALNNYHTNRVVKLYMMNTTLAGNFSASSDNTYAGGVGLRACRNPGEFYTINSLICDNYHYYTGNNNLISSDIASRDQSLREMMTDLRYTLYQSLIRQGNTAEGRSRYVEFRFDHCTTLSPDEARGEVFADYYASKRTYQNNRITQKDIHGAQLVSKDDGSFDADIARYAPIKRQGGKAVLGDQGVYTYFDASDWKKGIVKMSYRTVTPGAKIGDLTQAAGDMVAMPGLEAATDADMVTNYYESATGRSFGVAGASGWLENEVNHYVVDLGGEIQGSKVSKGFVNWGTVSGVTLYGDTYEEGTTVTITATPGFSRKFLGWWEVAANGRKTRLSNAAVYTFQVTRNLTVYPAFSDISDVVMNPTPKVHVTMEDGQETKPLYPITVTTAWMSENYYRYKEKVDNLPTEAEKEAYLTELLERVDPETGLKMWQNYVLGIEPYSWDAALWIDSPQYKSHNGDFLRFKMNELAPVAGSGFQIRYRLDKRLGAAEAFARDKVNATGSFDVDVATDPTGLYVIDLLFVPDGEVTSEEYVTTVNTAGVLRVETRAERAALSVPWTKLSPFAAFGYVEDVAAVDLVKTTNLTAGDKLYVYDGASKMYKAWQLRESGLWEPVAVYALDAYGNVNWTGAEAANDSSVPRGAGLWLERQNTKGYVYLCGQYETAAVTTPVVAGWNLVGSPTTAACDLSQLKLEPATGDRIVVPTAAEPKNMTWKAGTEGSPGSWGYWENRLIERWGMKIAVPTWVENAVVPAGNAFWYIRPDGGESSTLNW